MRLYLKNTGLVKKKMYVFQHASPNDQSLSVRNFVVILQGAKNFQYLWLIGQNIVNIP